jgi:hypothetical protein
MTNNIKSIARSFIIVPMLATSMTMNVAMTSVQAALDNASKDVPVIVQTPEELEHQKQMNITAQKIDAYFAQYNLPLAGYGAVFVEEAEKNDIPWTLLAAIGMAESTGGKFAIRGTYNYYGWGSGRIKFASVEDAIVQISANLGGNDDDTAHFYKDKSLQQILHMYNPPKVAPGYEAKIMRIMKQIEAMPVE